MRRGILLGAFVMFFSVGNGWCQSSCTLFDLAVECIKRFEGWHGPDKFPYVGYGHRVLPGECFPEVLTLEMEDSLLRSDLRRKCAAFRGFGKDSLLLGVLAYHVGESRLLGVGGFAKSRLIEKLEAGDRDIFEEYVRFRMYRGVVLRSIERRRRVEFDLFYIRD